MQLWLVTFFITFSMVHSRTFTGEFEIKLQDDFKPGVLFEMQDRTFQFDSSGSINMTIECDKDMVDWGTSLPLNIFLCDESPKTSWLHLYSQWGPCYTRQHNYYHCQIYPMTMISTTTATFYHEFDEGQFIVSRLRSCPIYTHNLGNSLQDTVQDNNYQCTYKGIYLNNDKLLKLSLDETWSPLLFQTVCVIYGLLCIKAIYEIIRYHKYHVSMSYIMYLFLVSKLVLVISIAVYYNRIENTGDEGYKEYEYAVNMAGAYRFACYYLTLLLICQGYGVMSSELIWRKSFYIISWFLVFSFFTLSAEVEDRYLVVAVVVITTALFSSIFTIMWAFQMKKIMFLRVTFYNREDWETHDKAQEQLRNKLALVMVSLVEVFAFLAFMIMYEFHHAESYPVPAFTGSLSLEIVEFLIILPLTEAYKLRDMSKFYPVPPPPPVYNVIRLPGDGEFAVSMEIEGKQKKVAVERCDRDFTVMIVPPETHRTRHIRRQRARDYRRSAMEVSDI